MVLQHFLGQILPLGRSYLQSVRQKPPLGRSYLQSVRQKPPPSRSILQSVRQKPPLGRLILQSVRQKPPPGRSILQSVGQKPPPSRSILQSVRQNHLRAGQFSSLSGRNHLWAGQFSSLSGRNHLQAGQFSSLSGRNHLRAGQFSSLSGRNHLWAGQFSSLSGRPCLWAARLLCLSGRQTPLLGLSSLQSVSDSEISCDSFVTRSSSDWWQSLTPWQIQFPTVLHATPGQPQALALPRQSTPSTTTTPSPCSATVSLEFYVTASCIFIRRLHFAISSFSTNLYFFHFHFRDSASMLSQTWDFGVVRSLKSRHVLVCKSNIVVFLLLKDNTSDSYRLAENLSIFCWINTNGRFFQLRLILKHRKPTLKPFLKPAIIPTA